MANHVEGGTRAPPSAHTREIAACMTTNYRDTRRCRHRLVSSNYWIEVSDCTKFLSITPRTTLEIERKALSTLAETPHATHGLPAQSPGPMTATVDLNAAPPGPRYTLAGAPWRRENKTENESPGPGMTGLVAFQEGGWGRWRAQHDHQRGGGIIPLVASEITGLGAVGLSIREPVRT